MNTSELAKIVSEDTGLTQSQARSAIKAVTRTIADTISNGEKIQVHGLGTFDTKFSPGRTLNAAMGGGTSADRTRPVFRAAKPLKDAVNDQ